MTPPPLKGKRVGREGKAALKLQIDALEALSRTRALTSIESCRLELAICELQGRRRSVGLTKEMARLRLKRSGRSVDWRLEQ